MTTRLDYINLWDDSLDDQITHLGSKPNTIPKPTTRGMPGAMSHSAIRVLISHVILLSDVPVSYLTRRYI